MTDIWQIILQSNILNFIIVLAFLCYLCSKLNFKGKIENLRNEIKSFVEESADEKINAEKELSDIKDKIVHLPQEIDNIKKSAKNSIESYERKINSDLKEQMLDIDNNVKRIMNLETKKFKSKLTGILSEASINLAKDNAVKQLENNSELHNQYIYDAINEIDRINL